MDDFLSDISGPIETDPEGAPRVGPIRAAVLAVPEKLGPNELEVQTNGRDRELYRRGLSRCAFEDQNPEIGEVTTVGELTAAEWIEVNAIFEKWADRIDAAREKDHARN
jgi:hypothetical protein